MNIRTAQRKTTRQRQEVDGWIVRNPTLATYTESSFSALNMLHWSTELPWLGVIADAVEDCCICLPKVLQCARDRLLLTSAPAAAVPAVRALTSPETIEPSGR